MDDSDTDATVSALLSRYLNLQDRLSTLRSSCEHAGRLHALSFSRSLHLSILKATELVDSVKNADADLILFHAGNEDLRKKEIKVRRWAGVLKTKGRMQEYHAQQAELQMLRTEAEQATRRFVNEKKRLIQKQIESVEASFSNTADSLQLGQDRLAELNKDVSKFSSSAVGAAMRQAHKACSDLDEKRVTVKRDIEQHEEKIAPAVTEKSKAQQELDQLTQKKEQLEQKQNGHYTLAGLSALGAVAAGAACVFIPTVLLAVVGVGALGSYVYNDTQGSNLRPEISASSKKVTEEKTVLSKAVVHLDDLNRELAIVDQRHTALANAISSTEEIGNKASKLRLEASEINMELRKVRLGLAPAEQALRRLAEQLEDDGYVGSRGQIAMHLRNIFLALEETGLACNKAFHQDWSKDPNFQIDHRLTTDAMRDIRSIGLATHAVLEVMKVGVEAPG